MNLFLLLSIWILLLLLLFSSHTFAKLRFRYYSQRFSSHSQSFPSLSDDQDDTQSQADWQESFPNYISVQEVLARYWLAMVRYGRASGSRWSQEGSRQEVRAGLWTTWANRCKYYWERNTTWNKHGSNLSKETIINGNMITLAEFNEQNLTVQLLIFWRILGLVAAISTNAVANDRLPARRPKNTPTSRKIIREVRNWILYRVKKMLAYRRAMNTKSDWLCRVRYLLSFFLSPYSSMSRGEDVLGSSDLSDFMDSNTNESDWPERKQFHVASAGKNCPYTVISYAYFHSLLSPCFTCSGTWMET